MGNGRTKHFESRFNKLILKQIKNDDTQTPEETL